MPVPKNHYGITQDTAMKVSKTAQAGMGFDSESSGKFSVISPDFFYLIYMLFNAVRQLLQNVFGGY